MPYIPCVPAWSMYQSASKLLIFNIPINVLACQRCANYSPWHAQHAVGAHIFNFTWQKVYQFFNYFWKEFLNFWIFQLCSIFANFKNTWAIIEKLSRETKNSNFGISKILLRKNLVNLKPLMSLSVEHVGLTKQLSASVKWSWIYYFIYQILYNMCKKAYLEKHRSCTP